MTISLDEDMFGFDPAEIILPNMVLCAGVLIRLNGGAGFVGMHFTPLTTTEEITTAVTYAHTRLIPAGTGIHELVFFVDKSDWGAAKVTQDSQILQTAFGVAPTIKAKPPNPDGSATLDLRLHAPVSPSSTSWIGVRKGDTGPKTLTSPPNNNVLKVKNTKQPSVVVAPIQLVPNNRSGFQPI